MSAGITSTTVSPKLRGIVSARNGHVMQQASIERQEEGGVAGMGHVELLASGRGSAC